MRVLVVYCHYNPDSFTHAILEQVTAGLDEAGHDYTVNDLNESAFDPVFRLEDSVQFIHRTVPEDLLPEAQLREAVVGMAGGPARRWMARRWIRGRSREEIIDEVAKHKPADVQAEQKLVAEADALIFIAPVFWMGMPAVMKGWIERVFTYGFAYTLDDDGWRGDLNGRVPLLTQEKGLIVTPTFFTEEEYDRGWRTAMDTVLCEWSLKMAGVKEARHEYLYAVLAASDEQRQEHLRTAHRLGREF